MNHSFHLPFQTLTQFSNNFCPLHHLAPRLQTWLKHRGSMTRLMEQTGKLVTIEVKRHQLALPSLREMQRLGINERRFSIIREIYMYCDDEAWLFARSIIPLNILKGRLNRLRAQGELPLGKILFREPNLRRSLFAFSQLTATDSLLSSLTIHFPHFLNQSPLWQRESLFFLPQSPLLLTEIFLPPMLHYLTRNTAC